MSVVFTLWPRLCVKCPYYCVRSRFPTFARYSFISLFLFLLSGLPLVIHFHRLGRVVVYVATSNDPTARGYLPAKAVGWLRPAGRTWSPLTSKTVLTSMAKHSDWLLHSHVTRSRFYVYTGSHFVFSSNRSVFFCCDSHYLLIFWL